MDILIILLMLAIICHFFIFLNRTIYCNVFERDEVEVYNRLNKLEASDFYKEGYRYYTDKYPNYYIVLWENGVASVYDSTIKGDNCIACTFYERGSKKLYQKLKNIEKFFARQELEMYAQKCGCEDIEELRHIVENIKYIFNVYDRE